MADAITATRFPFIAQHSREYILLADRLKDGKPGDKIADAELAKLTGKDGVTLKGLIARVANYTMKAAGLRWERIRKAGMIQCLDDSGKLSSIRKDIKSIHRKSKRTGIKLAITNPMNLDEKERSEFLAHKAQVGTLAMFSGSAAQKSLATTASDAEKTRAMQIKMLEAMK